MEQFTAFHTTRTEHRHSLVCFGTWIDLEAIHRGIRRIDEKCIRPGTREKSKAKGDKRDLQGRSGSVPF